jgi:hypothetical protein
MQALCEKFCLRESVARLGPDLFTCNTTYIIPGWNALASDDSHADHGLCVLVTSFNLALNFARALAWFSGRVTLAIDHTFKVRLRLRCTCHNTPLDLTTRHSIEHTQVLIEYALVQRFGCVVTSPHTTIYLVSSYYYISSVLILLYIAFSSQQADTHI